MSAVFAVDACRTPVGKIKGALSGVRPDHLTAGVLRGVGQGIATLWETA